MRKKVLTVFEIVAWSALFFVPLFFISTLLHPDVDVKRTYSADFNDINGIIVGSPVNFIGYNVGYVKKIKILDNKVRLDIAIVKDDYELPECSVIKVEETGLGGSRSLEIFPCEGDNTSPGISTTSPKRIDDLMKESCTFVKDLVQGTGNLYLSFESSLGHNTPEKFDQTQQKLKNMKQSLETTSSNLTIIKKNANKNLPVCNKKMTEIIGVVSKIKFNPEQVKTTAIRNQQTIEEINKLVSKYSAAEYKEASRKLYLQTAYIGPVNKEEIVELLIKINEIMAKVQNMSQVIDEKVKSNFLQELEQKTQDIKNDTENLIKEDSKCTHN